MIITLKGADFSEFNIGTLSTWRITRSLGSGATYEGVTSVDKGASFSATITIAEGYELGTAGVTITMGGVALSGVATVSGNVVTISIAEVTGNVVIKVPTVNTSTGDSGDVGDGGDGSETIAPSGELGSETNPYLITTAAELVAFGAEVDAGDNKAGKCYALNNDIDLADAAFDPIGENSSSSSSVGFAGIFDGRGHVIKGLNVSGWKYAGLFGTNMTGTVMNLGIEDSTINASEGSGTAGSIARKMTAGTGKIVNCYSLASVSGTTRASGLVDEIASGDIVAGCYFMGTVSATAAYGLIASRDAKGTMAYCYCTGDKAYQSTSMSVTDSSIKTASEINAALMNGNLNAVAEVASINASSLCDWEDGTEGHPVLKAKPTIVGGTTVGGGTTTDPEPEEPTVPTAYTLTISKGTGVENVTVTKTSGYGTTGTLNSGATIYAGDKLTVSATASSGYTLDSYTSSITVNGNVTVNVTATAETPAPDDVTTFAGGTGTETDPYLISTAAELKLLHDTVDSGTSTSENYYALTNDIDLSVYSTWDPIGASYKSTYSDSDNSGSFTGVLDGRGHVIRNMTVTGVQYAGLFGANFNGTIMNLGMEGGNVSTDHASSTCGAIARKGAGKIVNCYSMVPTQAVARSSGIVDELEDGGMVLGCYQAAVVTAGTGGAFAIKGATTTTGTIHYCLWDSDLTSNGVNGTATSLTSNFSDNTSLTTAEFATAASTLNNNLDTVATEAGIDVTKLCTWEDGTDGYPKLQVMEVKSA